MNSLKISRFTLYTDESKKLKTLIRYSLFLSNRKLAHNLLPDGTASCEAGRINSLSGITVINTVRGQALFRSYGRLFAEFLDEESLVRLGLLDLSTCVGLRYG